MKPTFILRTPFFSDWQDHTTAGDATGVTKEQMEALQKQRQQFDMALDEAVEGLQGIQQILTELKGTYFSVSVVDVSPQLKLKVQRTSHHCTRLLAEIQQHVLPFSQELQILHTNPLSGEDE